jgi:aspartate beta-hydroxylase
VAYHNTECQQVHWKKEHKRDCKTLQGALRPLQDLIAASPGGSSWWNQVSVHEHRHNDTIWHSSVQEWYRQDYLVAMQGFQQALEPYKRAWEDAATGNQKDTMGTQRYTASERALVLARRLLFCAYCELDGNQIDSARQRLVQCLSLLTSTCSSNQIVLNDAWMELMLSMEEVPQHRILARHVAHMAIATKTNACGWKDPLQRPGYMAMLEGIPCYKPPEQHPLWCQVLEQNWKSILQEYMSLQNHANCWSRVGSGDRGSGQDDHRVVSGEKWTEYVLFGTGSSHEHNHVPFTKGMLQQHVPDAVSLAQQGGGEVILSRLAPHTHIQAHCGPTNLRWTAHLGLVVPTDTGRCQIRVGTQWYSWQPGKILLFDDSYEHEVRNDTDQERVVLLMRVWHPKLTIKQREQFMLEARAKKEETIEKRYHPPS